MYVVRPAAAAAAAFLGLTLTVLCGTAAAAASAPGPGPAAPSAGPGPMGLGGPVVYAHRGASAYAPENTLEAVDLARGLGFDWVENDVQRTRDGELVVIHDDTLTRTTDVEEVFPDREPWRVRDFTAAEIARLDAGSWFADGRYTGARVPTLREYLDRVRLNQQRLLLEIKKPELYPGIEEDTLEVLDEAGWLEERRVADRLVVQSFSADSVSVVHDLRPDLVTAFLGTPAVADLPRYAEFTDRINPLHTTISADWVAAVHRLRGAHGRVMEVDTWIVDDAATARKVQDMGVDGIITNAPDVVREAVGGS
ncbi:glycerophosphodiester phosphodiesterase family protein [Streptomyces sp. Isolate_45]|uniref:glycerophosphodiester phosphodiesterase n=1 Tax=Streptomyces sp. Isolate_45 TaxID=2950111 RepID=UPI002481AF01|nr:glycerophosphodiester phosphodiesterase family protein [Streptomyces sp. Isolate_45]MDA5284416.1 glycerophosphodiester phosphodiesterase family protein [Streptomyces sp. Isolate_45]